MRREKVFGTGRGGGGSRQKRVSLCNKDAFKQYTVVLNVIHFVFVHNLLAYILFLNILRVNGIELLKVNCPILATNNSCLVYNVEARDHNLIFLIIFA